MTNEATKQTAVTPVVQAPVDPEIVIKKTIKTVRAAEAKSDKKNRTAPTPARK